LLCLKSSSLPRHETFDDAVARITNTDMKSLLICLSLLLLGGCGLFHETPPSVVKGQRAVYESVLLLEENSNEIIDRYVEDTKAAVTYHLYFVCENRIKDIERQVYSDEYIKRRSDELRSERDHKIRDAHKDIDKIASEMRLQISTNHNVVRKLIAAIYNYMSATPIELDQLDFWVDKLHKVSQK